MRHRLLRFGIWLAAGVTVLIVLVVIGAAVYSRTEHFRSLFREQVLAALHNTLNGEVAFERMSGSIWREVVIHNLSIRQDGVDVIVVPRARIQVALLAQALSFLRSSELHVAQIDLATPVVRLVQGQDGQWNLARLVKTSEEAPQESTISIYLDRITLGEGQIEVRQTGDVESRVSALALDGSVALLPKGVQAELATLNFSLARAGVPDVQWSSAFAYDQTTSPDKLEIEQLALRTAGSRLQAAGSVENLATPVAALAVKIDKLSAAEIKALVPTSPLQQDLSGTVGVSGPLSALQVLAALNAQSGNITVTATANVEQTPPHIQGKVEAKKFVVHEVLLLPDVGGEVNGEMSFNWTTLEAAESGIQAQAAGLTVQGWQLGTVNLTARLQKGQLELTTEAKGKTGEAKVHGQVSIVEPFHYEVNASVNQLDLVKVSTQGQGKPLTGSVNMDAWVKGQGTSLADLDAATKLTLRPSKIGSIAVTRGQIDGKVHNGQVTLDALELVANDTTVTAHGQIGKLTDTPDGKITYTVSARNLTPWLELAGQKGKGSVNLKGSASGQLTALRLEGQSTLSNVQVGTSAVENGKIDYTLTGIGGTDPRGQVKAALKNIEAGTRLQAVDTTLAFVGLEPAVVDVESAVRDEAGRSHRVKTKVRYQSERIEAAVQELAIQLPTGTWRTVENAQVAVQGNTVTIDNLALRRAQQTVKVEGKLSLQGDQTQDVRLQVNDLSLAEVRSFLGEMKESPEVNGRLTADVRLQGTAAAPTMQANLQTEALTVAQQTYAGLNFQGSYRDNQFKLSLVFRQDASHSLTAEGTIPLTLAWADGKTPELRGDMNLRVRSDGLSLAFLGLLNKDVQEVQGLLSMNVQIRGPVDALTPSGEIAVSDGQARVRQLGVLLTDLQVRLGLTPDAVQITRLNIRSGDGTISGTGKIGLHQYTVKDLALALTADRFRVINTHEYIAAVSGKLTGSGSMDNAVMRGELNVHDTTLRPNLALLQSGAAPPDPTIVVASTEQELTRLEKQAEEAAKQPKKTEEPPPDMYRQLTIDVGVTIPRGTWVHLDDGSVELMGQVRAKKKPTEDVVLTGTIETVRGWYTFQGKKFRVEKGRVVMTGNSPIDPSLDIVARYTLPDYKVDVLIGGTANTPELTLQSQPPLEQADILAILAFGRPVNQLSSGEKGSLQNKALQMTAGYVVSDLRRSVADKLGLDNLEVDVGKNLAESQIGVGKQATEKVFISTSRKLGNKSEQEVAVEYQLGTNWQLKSSTTTEGNHGVDLFWEKRY